MRLTVNGDAMELSPAANLAELLRLLDVDPGGPGIAVASNGRVVPRSELSACPVREGDRIEVVRAVQGG